MSHHSDIADLIRERELQRRNDRYASEYDAGFVEFEDHEPAPYVDTRLPFLPTLGLVQDEQGREDGRCYGRDDDPGCWREDDAQIRWPA